ncbi:hypothetical protein SmJEL517_g00356 [Synchytrium microbalum]|uniref:DH domain-containing protein n=1 Tax=Synchytrium microbalum TaxID=1806994 RepID=A0A507CF52_9FUNG|nr:uncharacterized protein SmJEL517_g00356 [Synchytrium microbalum]TPX38121.1 hypothetical protein SmJEL517_g00356 [Synchytrium microbalum]
MATPRPVVTTGGPPNNMGGEETQEKVAAARTVLEARYSQRPGSAAGDGGTIGPNRRQRRPTNEAESNPMGSMSLKKKSQSNASWNALFRSKSKCEHDNTEEVGDSGTSLESAKSKEVGADDDSSIEGGSNGSVNDSQQVRSWYLKYKRPMPGDDSSLRLSMAPGDASTLDIDAPLSPTAAHERQFSEVSVTSVSEGDGIPAGKKKINPLAQIGGVLAHDKWFVLDDSEVNFETAPASGLGHVTSWDDGRPRFVIALEKLPKEELKRQEVIYELLITEREYVRDLHIVINLFMKNMRDKSIVPGKDLHVVFSNIEQLLPVNQELLSRLEERRRLSNGVVKEVADIFIKVEQYFKIYTLYCANQPEAMAYLKREKGNEDLRGFLMYCFLRPDCRGLDIGAFLIKPVQRVCKYPLILKELLKHTPVGHPDRANLELAATNINKVVDVVNERRRFVENQQKMLAIMQKLEFSEGSLVHEPSRRYINEGMLSRFDLGMSMNTAERYVVLFSDCLIIAKYGVIKNKKAQVSKIYPLSVLETVEIVPDTTAKSAFSLSIQERKDPYIFECASDKERKIWMDSFNSAIRDAKDCISPTGIKGSSSIQLSLIERQLSDMKPGAMTWSPANLEAARQMMSSRSISSKTKTSSTDISLLASSDPALVKRSSSMPRVEEIGAPIPRPPDVASKPEGSGSPRLRRVRKSGETINVDSRLSIQSIPSSAPPVPARPSPSSTSLSSLAAGGPSKPPPIPPKKPSSPTRASMSGPSTNTMVASPTPTTPTISEAPTISTTPTPKSPSHAEPISTRPVISAPQPKAPALGGGGSRVRELAALYGSTLTSALPSRIESSDVSKPPPLLPKPKHQQQPLHHHQQESSVALTPEVIPKPAALHTDVVPKPSITTEHHTPTENSSNTIKKSGPPPPLAPSPAALKAQQQQYSPAPVAQNDLHSVGQSLVNTINSNNTSHVVKPAPSAAAAAKNLRERKAHPQE